MRLHPQFLLGRRQGYPNEIGFHISHLGNYFVTFYVSKRMHRRAVSTYEIEFAETLSQSLTEFSDLRWISTIKKMPEAATLFFFENTIHQVRPIYAGHRS